MPEFYRDDHVTLLHGHALDMLKTLPDGSVNCCVTSPPYFGLRDYQEVGQYGLEKSPSEYVEAMRELFAEVRRVLADDGTLWLNLGDSFSTGGAVKTANTNTGFNERWGNAVGAKKQESGRPSARCDKAEVSGPRLRWDDVPAKNLLGIPWRVAFALQDDGWILRNDIIWSKPNGMPESVTDRLASKHEHLFLFSKSRRYWFDLDPIREQHSEATAARLALGPVAIARRTPGEKRSANIYGAAAGTNLTATGERHLAGAEGGKNPGDVWTIPTQPFPGAHFAVFPVEIPRRCIAAGCAPKVCRECGHKPEPTKKRGGMDMDRPQARRAMEIATEHGLTEEHFDAIRSAGATDAGKAAVTQSGTGKNTARVTELAAEAKRVLKGYYREFLLDRMVTDGWTDCGHNAYDAGTVLDPFSGSGTTGLAAGQLGRKYIGIDLSRKYLELSLQTRLAQTALIDGGAA